MVIRVCSYNKEALLKTLGEQVEKAHTLTRRMLLPTGFMPVFLQSRNESRDAALKIKYKTGGCKEEADWNAEA